MQNNNHIELSILKETNPQNKKSITKSKPTISNTINKLNMGESQNNNQHVNKENNPESQNNTLQPNITNTTEKKLTQNKN